MESNFTFIVNNKATEKTLAQPKVFGSKKFTKTMEEIINKKLSSAHNKKAMQHFIDVINKINNTCDSLFLVYSLEDKKNGKKTNTIEWEESIQNNNNSKYWNNQSVVNVKSKIEKDELFILVSDGRPPYTYFQMGLTMIDLALHLKIDLEFDIECDGESILKIENKKEKEIFKTYNSNLEEIKNPENEFEFLNSNIEFKIGQPNTGKSHSFEENQLFPTADKNTYEYYKIMVEGGNDSLKSLTSEDIAISYNPAKNEVYLSKFIKTIMSAIINNKSPHVIFLDDFHNVDISSLLSPYMGMLKKFQKFENIENNIIEDSYESLENYTDKWNNYVEKIESHNEELNIFTIENKINGQQVKLFAPSNLYIVGAANWNFNTINMFSDIRDRANINYVELDQEKTDKQTISFDKNGYESIIKHINYTLRNVLEDSEIYDFEKYGIGIHRVKKMKDFKKESIEKDLYGAFDLIRDSIQQNGKKGSMNDVAYSLLKELSKNTTISDILSLDNTFVQDNYISLEDDENKDSLREVNRKLYYLNLYSS